MRNNLVLKILFMALIQLLLLSKIILAQTLTPIETGGPEGGTINSICISEENIMYAGTQGGLYIKNSTSNSWERVIIKITESIDLSFNNVNQVLKHKNRIYLLCDFSIVYSDDGKTWKYLESSFEITTYLSFKNILLIHAEKLYLKSKNHIYKYNETLSDWEKLTDVFQDMSLTSFVSANDFLWIGTEGNGVYKSENSGTDWVEMNDSLKNLNITVLDYQSHLYAGTKKGLFYYNNDSSKWFSVNREKFGNSNIRTLKLTSDNSIYICVNSWGFFKSNDGGKNWSQHWEGLVSGGHRTINQFVKRNNSLYIATDDWGIYKSNNDGMSWSALNNNLIASSSPVLIKNNNIYALGRGLFQYFPQNGKWELLWSSVHSSYVIDNENRIYNDSGIGFFQTSTNLRDWKIVHYDSIGKSTIALITDEENNLFLTNRNGIFKSSNRGESWNNITGNLNDFVFLGNPFIHPEGDYFVVKYSNQRTYKLYHSEDNGKNWFEVNLPTEVDNIQGINANSKGRLFITVSSKGVYYSDNKGITWIHPETPPLSYYQGIKLFKDSLVVVSTQSKFIYSRNAGETWKKLNWDYDLRVILSSFDFDNDGNLYFGTSRHGVYKINNQTFKDNIVSVENIMLIANNPIIYPNPFHSVVNISTTENIRLAKIYSIDGKLISTLKPENSQSANSFFQWNGKDEKNVETMTGVYLVSFFDQNNKIISKSKIIKQ